MNRKKRSGLLALVCFLGAAALLPACGRAEQQPEIQVLTIGTADSGGTMYPVGRAIAEVLNEYAPALKINTGASSGSTANVEGLRTGQIDLALVSGDVAYCAFRGTEEFDGKPMTDLRAIGAMYISTSNWMAADTLGVEYVHDLPGSRVAVGPENSTTELAARVALAAVGIDDGNTRLENKGLGSGAEALKGGELDAVHAFAGAPVAGLRTLAEALPCRLLRYTDAELQAILDTDNQYVSATIPAGTYAGQTEDVETFGVKCLLCVSSAMDDALAEAITQILMESTGDLAERHPALTATLDEGFLCDDIPVPLHPGAERFYKAAGLVGE